MTLGGLVDFVLGRADISHFIFVQFTDQNRPEVNTPHPSPLGLESDIISHKSLPDKSPVSTPADFSVALDPTPHPASGIFPWLYFPGQLSPALLVIRRWHIHL